MPGRGPPEHKIIYLPDSSMGHGSAISWDDHLSFNTQSSSQWDSLCHYQHQPTGLAYNGYRPTKESLAAASSSDAPTLEHWHDRGGLVARGVLIDFKAYADDTGLPFHAYSGTAITPAQLEACAAHQGVEFHPGDLLIVRTGATEIIDNITAEQFGQMMQSAGGVGLSGLEGSEDMARWLWNKRFAGVASDSNALEVYPPVKPDGTKGNVDDLGKSYSPPLPPLFPHSSYWRTTLLTICLCSSSPVHAWLLRDAHRRAVGSQPALEVLPREEAVLLHVDVCAPEPPWPDWVSSQCYRDSMIPETSWTYIISYNESIYLDIIRLDKYILHEMSHYSHGLDLSYIMFLRDK